MSNTKYFLKMFASAAIVTSVALSGCKSKQAVVPAYPQPPAPQPAMQLYELPCWMPDDDDFFRASSSATGPANQQAVIQRAALGNAQAIVRQKMQHAYMGMVSDYANLIGSNAGVNARSNFEAAGDQIIDAIVNATSEKCVRFTAVDDAGHVTYYIGIEISKKRAANTIADGLDKNEELDIRFHEFNYRQRMEEKFKEYKESR